MLTVRRSEERHHIQNDGQNTWVTFDWGNKADPLRDGFGVLKILNEETLSPGRGFILHTHNDMVVVTYVQAGMVIYKGTLEEPDFLETKEFQRINSTPDTKQYVFNPSQSEDAHVFQSGFTPQAGALRPGSLKKLFTHAERQGILKLIASPDGREGSLPIQQDVYMYSTYAHNGNHVVHEITAGRTTWLHVVKGEVQMADLHLKTGDAVGVSDERSISFTAKGPTEILLFDLCAPVPDKLTKNSDVNRQNAMMN